MKFDLKEFNVEQKQAITHGDGPLLIVAGAGTGKTKVITGRILHLILEKKVKPENILALTFTEKASNEMQTRVDRELPLGTGDCWIKTFHGFCDALLRERGHEIGLSTDYKILTDIDQWMLLKKNLFRFSLDYYRPLGNPQKFLGTLLSHFSRLKDEDIQPQAYIEYSEKFLQRAMSEEEREEGRRMLEVAKTYAEYQKLLIEENNLDYGDLITWVLRLFEKRKNVLSDYQKRFTHILVDEFQDTNYAQNKLIFFLASNAGLPSLRSCVVVGDDDQAIYKWRGASVVNILNFEKTYPKTKSLVLSKNYRSKQNILDAAYHLIRANDPYRLEVELDIPKKLHAIQKGKGLIEIHHFQHYVREVDFVVSRIEKLLEEGKSDCAILVRANSHAKPFVEAFRKKRIPYQHLAEENLFTQPVVKDLVCLLRFLADPKDDISLFRILSLPVWQLDMKFLLGLNKEARRRHLSLYEVFQNSSEAPKLLRDLLEQLLALSREHPVSLLLSTFLDSQYGKTLASDEGFTAGDPLQKLADFSEKVREYEFTHRTERVQEFVEYLELLEKAGDSKGFEGEIDRDLPKILTIHASKGLEFDSVFLVDLVKERFPLPARREGIEIPYSLIPEKIPEGERHLEEERRLFYVGMTRAKENLFLTWSDYYEGKKLWKPSPFTLQVEEFLNRDGKRKRSRRSYQSEMSPPGDTLLPSRKHQPLTKLTIPLSTLSFSQLDTFQTCPLKYRFRYLLHLPSLPSPALNYGLSLHNTLSHFYRYLQDRSLAKRELTIDPLEMDHYLQKLRETYEAQWIPYGYETREHAQKRKERGFQTLEQMFVNQGNRWKLPTSIEEFFRLPVGKVIFSGRFDRIDELEDGTYEIIDYKTGSKVKAAEADRDLQLSLYALAATEVLKLPVSKLTLWFLEENEKVSTTRSKENLKKLKGELLEMIDELQESDFSATPGHHCGYCDYRGICDYAMIRL